MGNSIEKSSSVELKPIPQTYEALSKEVQAKSLLHIGPTANPSPRDKLCHFMMTSEKINRSPCYASILLVGSSGVGKSSTINHLLNTGDAIQFAKTSDSQSETRNTSEFILTVDEPKCEVSDLQLGIVDTPGFNDTDGLEQDACNFYSIKQFYETHPKLSGCYPNLIFLLVQATDTRIGGRNSNLSKSLRCLKQLGLVDQRHPNVVAILTFCCSVNHKNVAIWEEEMEKKKASIHRIVSEALEVPTAPVVVLENYYGRCELKVDGDFTRLPNGELQPKNLYNACKEVMKENSDHFGLMTLNACFDKPKKMGLPKTGHKTKAKNASEESLNAEEEEIVKLLEKAGKGGRNHPIFGIAEQYVKEESLNHQQEQEVEKLACTLKKMGVDDKDECTSISKESVEYFYENEISSTGADMLQKKFGIKKKAVVLDSGDLVGHGYNILTDKPTSAQIMEFETEEKDFGFVLPTCAKLEKVNQTRSFLGHFIDEKSYVQSRLDNLNIGLDVQHDIFKMGARVGFNRNESCSGESSNSGHSVLHERRMFKVKIANFKEEKNGITFTSDFESDVKKLPDEYKKDDLKNRKCFERFFSRFGHFIVSSAYGGGAVEMTVSEQSVKSEGEKKNLGDAKASFPGAFFGVGGEATGGPSSSLTAMSKGLLNQTKVQWSGGSPDLHTNDTLASQEKMLKWQTSLLVKPTLLDTEMTLEPISTVIGCIDDGKSAATYDALEDLLGGKFKLFASKEEEEERKKKMEAERMRIESSTRSGTVEDPDTNGWWATLWKIGAGAGTTVGVIAVVAMCILKLK